MRHLFLILFFIGCAASPQNIKDNPKAFLEDCANIENYTLEYNGNLYRLLWPNKDVAGYFDTKEEAIDYRDKLAWQAQIYLWKMEEKWERVNEPEQ